MKGKLPQSVDLIVTSDCNLKCPVCWGSDMPEYEEKPLKDRLNMLDIVAKSGVSTTVFTGGEPLLYDHLGRLISHSQDLSLDTLLFTNSLELPRKADSILPYVTLLFMSLDGSNEMMDAVARRQGHFDKVLESISLISQQYRQLPFQIITVVTQVNKDDLYHIGDLLHELTNRLSFCWKLNYYNPIGRKPAEHLLLEHQEYLQKAKELQQHFSGRLKVRFSSENHDFSYLFLFPDGKMYTTCGREYIYVGDIFNVGSYNDDMLKKIDNGISLRRSRVQK